MTDRPALERDTFVTEVDGVPLRVAALHRAGQGAPIVCLHGFGSTKEDYADLAWHPRFQGRRVMAFDAPGCGETDCGNLAALTIPFLRETAVRVLRHFGIERFHLVGHSMGGLTALLLARDLGDAVLSFTNVEGNVAPEDCFLSRQILRHPTEDPHAFLTAFAARAWQSPGASQALFAAALPAKVRAEAVAPIFRSMVEISDREALLDSFVDLPCPKMFVYGEENRSLSYLGTLLRRGVQLAEIEQSGHWPMYANPTRLWERLGQFVEQSEIAPLQA